MSEQETERKQAVRRLLMLTALEAAVAAEKAKVRALVGPMFTDGGDREAASAPDGTALGNVRLDGGKATWKVTDADAFAEWVDLATAGSELTIVRTATVNPAYERSVLSRLAGDGWSWINPETGEEQHDVPAGVELVSAKPRLVVTGDKDAGDYVVQRLRESSSQLLQLGGE